MNTTSEILTEALAAVKKAKVPPELQGVALCEAIRLLAEAGGVSPATEDAAAVSRAGGEAAAPSGGSE